MADQAVVRVEVSDHVVDSGRYAFIASAVIESNNLTAITQLFNIARVRKHHAG
ncbi:Uncharacterised protein [Vibrio cholerae]|nr:Uncharacterised protein [Vibrio cholerae]